MIKRGEEHDLMSFFMTWCSQFNYSNSKSEDLKDICNYIRDNRNDASYENQRIWCHIINKVWDYAYEHFPEENNIAERYSLRMYWMYSQNRFSND